MDNVSSSTLEKEPRYHIVKAFQKVMDNFASGFGAGLKDYNNVTKAVVTGREIVTDHYRQILEIIENGKKYISPVFITETIERSITFGINMILSQMNLPAHQVVKKLSASVDFLNTIIDKELKSELKNDLNDFDIVKQNSKLEDRLKILDCLYEISKISEKQNITLEEIIKKILELIPSAWPFPEKICARIIINNQIYSTDNYKTTPWRHTNDIIVNEERVGMVEISLLEDRSPKESNSFTKGEKHLVYLISERIGDLVEWVKTEEENKKYQAQINESQKMDAIATLAGGIAHEINNALFGITGNIELIQKNFADERLNKYIVPILNSSTRISNLINRLLAYARGGKYRSQQISLNLLIKDLLPAFQQSINSDIQLESILDSDISEIKGDIGQIKTVISAILENSADAIQNSGKIRISTLEKEIDEQSAKANLYFKQGKYVCVMIEDNGKGMDNEAKERIFEPFFTTKFQGRGLDMAAAYGIIQNHNGWIRVESELNKGTIVYIGFPAVKSENEKLETYLNMEKSNLSKGSNKKLIEENILSETKNLHISIPTRLAERVRSYALQNNSTTTGVVIEALDTLLLDQKKSKFTSNSII